jgi:hypothetical protein
MCFCICLVANASAALDIQPRLQWEANNGYCGEVSFISAGLYFGQYCSQYEARSLASPGVPQSDPDSQLLLGVNAMKAAKAMKLEAREFDTVAQQTDSEFVNWVQKEVKQNRPVIIALLMNYYKFYGEKQGGDEEYDHIVPVLGAESGSNGKLSWSDNGLWAPNDKPPFLFSGGFSSLFKSRTQANSPSAPVYSINNDLADYGASVSGVMDTNKDTVRVRLATNVNYESPSMKEGGNSRPAPMPLELTATVEIPDQNVGYNLYLYKSFAAVPTSKFNANAKKASQTWKIAAKSGPKYTVKVNIQSDQVAVFRAVRTTAP